jgi:thiol-disulfide isomerase/thioredoxin
MSLKKHLLLFLSLALLPACTEGPSTTREDDPSVSFTPLSFAEWREKLDGYEGDIVVVDFWATWCVPCLERFPAMVQLHERFGTRGVRFVSMCLDDRGDKIALERAREFLARQKAVFENYLMDEVITDAFEELGLQSIPAVLVYDREGNPYARLTGDDPNNQFTDEDVESAILQLLETSRRNGFSEATGMP